MHRLNKRDKDSNSDESLDEMSDGEESPEGLEDGSDSGKGEEDEGDDDESGSDSGEGSSDDDDDDDDGSIFQDSDNEAEPDFNIYSDNRGLQSDVSKGRAIRNQIRIWEQLIEWRIKLQKCLVISNKLYQKNDFKNFEESLDENEKTKVNSFVNSLPELLNSMLSLQNLMMASSDNKNDNDDEDDESIPSDTDEENNVEAEKKPSVSPSSKKPIKHKKLTKIPDFSNLLAQQHADFKDLRNKIIQKWNDKTRVSSGKVSSSNFSAFEQSAVKQIEQTLCEQDKLVRRTQTKRSVYSILGKRKLEAGDAEDDSKEAKKNEIDPEIFDDDDFYHKLLRDFISHKTSDINDPTQLGRQWVELQKYRNKMETKKKTYSYRLTKERTLSYTVHNKLVNFMAPVPYNTWSDQAETDLYNSLFGKAIKR